MPYSMPWISQTTLLPHSNSPTASLPWTLHDLDYFNFCPTRISRRFETGRMCCVATTGWQASRVAVPKAEGSSRVQKMGCFATVLPNVLYLTQDGMAATLSRLATVPKHTTGKRDTLCSTTTAYYTLKRCILIACATSSEHWRLMRLAPAPQ